MCRTFGEHLPNEHRTPVGGCVCEGVRSFLLPFGRAKVVLGYGWGGKQYVVCYVVFCTEQYIFIQTVV